MEKYDAEMVNSPKGLYETTEQTVAHWQFLVIKVIRNNEAIIYELTIEVSRHRT